jgi:hypothetical protein
VPVKVNGPDAADAAETWKVPKERSAEPIDIPDSKVEMTADTPDISDAKVPDAYESPEIVEP